MPDRLPSLIVLVAFWIPPAVAGWVAARRVARGDSSTSPKAIYAVLTLFVLAYAAAWFLFNVTRMPPYIPGSTMDPTFAPSGAVAWLAAVTAALILPGSALACAWAFRRRLRIT